MAEPLKMVYEKDAPLDALQGQDGGRHRASARRATPTP